MQNRKNRLSHIFKKLKEIKLSKITSFDEEIQADSNDNRMRRMNGWDYSPMHPDSRKNLLEVAPEPIYLIYKSTFEMVKCLKVAKDLFNDTSLTMYWLPKYAELLYLIANNKYGFMFKSVANDTQWEKLASRGRRSVAACLDYLGDEIIASGLTHSELPQIAQGLKQKANPFLKDDELRKNKRAQISVIIEDTLAEEEAASLEQAMSFTLQKRAFFVDGLAQIGEYLKNLDLPDAKEDSNQQLHQLRMIAQALYEFAESDPAIEGVRYDEEERGEQAQIDLGVAAGCVSYFTDKMKTLVTAPYLQEKLKDLELQLQSWQIHAETSIIDTTIKKQLDDHIELLVYVTRDPNAPKESKEDESISLLNSDGSVNQANVQIYAQKLLQKETGVNVTFHSSDSNSICDVGCITAPQTLFSPAAASKSKKQIDDDLHARRQIL